MLARELAVFSTVSRAVGAPQASGLAPIPQGDAAKSAVGGFWGAERFFCKAFSSFQGSWSASVNQFPNTVR